MVLASQQGLRLTIEVEYKSVVAADDEQGGGGHSRQLWSGEVGPAAAGDDRSDPHVRLGGCPERGGSTGAGAELADGQPLSLGLPAQPAGGVREPPGEDTRVEDMGPVGLLCVGEQVPRGSGRPRGGAELFPPAVYPVTASPGAAA